MENRFIKFKTKNPHLEGTKRLKRVLWIYCRHKRQHTANCLMGEFKSKRYWGRISLYDRAIYGGQVAIVLKDNTVLSVPVD